MNWEGGKFKLVMYKVRVWNTDGEYTMSLSHLWWVKHLQVMSWLVFVLNE